MQKKISIYEAIKRFIASVGSRHRKIIFLDFDGVMDTGLYDNYLVRNGMANTDKYGPIFDPECVKALSHIIQETNAEIVVTSTWKQDLSIAELREMWRERSLPGTLLATTPNTNPHFRGDEIAHYLERQKGDIRYVIIDDMDATQFRNDQHPYLFCINPMVGLDIETADRIIYCLNKNVT